MTERDRLAERHFGLVHALCKRFANKGIEYEELFAAGCLGLTKALNHFDESRQLQFSTYAFPVIMGELKRLFRDGGAVRVSRSLKELSLKIARLNNESMQRNGTELTVSELSAALQAPVEKITEAIGCMQAPLSLTSDREDEGTELEIPSPDIQYEISERLTLRQAIAALEERDRLLVTLRYFQNKTQTQCAEILGMTQVQVSRKEKKILAQIREKVA